MSHTSTPRDARLDQEIEQAQLRAKAAASTSQMVSIIFSAVDPDRITLITANPETIAQHQLNGNQMMATSSKALADLLANNPVLHNALDDSAWQKVATKLMAGPPKTADTDLPAFFNTTPPDLPESLARARLSRLAQFRSPANQQALCELTEIVMANENQRPISTALFSEQSLSAQPWALNSPRTMDDLHRAYDEGTHKLNALMETTPRPATADFEEAQIRHDLSETLRLMQSHEDTQINQDDFDDGPSLR